MIKPPIQALRGERGVASIEFAFVASLLMLLCTCLADFAMAFFQKSLLAASVAEGANYAVLAGPSVSFPAIKGIVGQTLSIPAASITVAGPTCRCTTEGATFQAGTFATSVACNATCPAGGAPGTYVTINASLTYAAIFPLYSRLSSLTMTETATARLK